MKKISAGTIFLILLLTVLSNSGCIDDNNSMSSQIDLSTVGLSVEQVNYNFSISYENHSTETYIVEDGLLLEGWKIFEKYESQFQSDDYAFIQTIVRLESINKSDEFIQSVRTGYKSDFTEISTEEIGDNTYFSQNQSVFPNKTLYLHCFTINDIAVILFGTSPNEDDFPSYATYIAENIKNKS